MDDTVIWLGAGECVVDRKGASYIVTDERLLSSIDRWAAEATQHSRERSSNAPSAGTLASLSEMAGVSRYADAPSPASWVRPSRLTSHGRPTPMPAVSFGEVLEGRRSTRFFGTPTDTDLLGLLTYSTRSRFSWATDGGAVATSRPAPSAGARHPIEIVVAADDVRGLDSGLYWFDPVLCRLALLESDHDKAHRMAVAAQAPLETGDPPPVVLYLVAELRRTLERYRGGFSLILRDAGALIATICFVATALRLAVCPLGTGGHSPALDALQVPYPEWAGVGAIALGRPRGAD